MAPFQSSPPHCPYSGTVPPLAAELVAAFDVLVVVVVTNVVGVVAGVVVGELPPAPQVNGAGPGIVYDVRVW